MPKRFLSDERGQAGLEYILLVGGIIVTAVVLFAIYQSMTKGSADKLDESSSGASSAMSSKISSEVATMF